MWLGAGAFYSPAVDTQQPSANRQSLTHPGTYAERGKPTHISCQQVGASQEGLMEMWVQEDGKSKRHLVMRWIGDERTHRDPTRKRADFHLVSHHERVWQTTKGGKA